MEVEFENQVLKIEFNPFNNKEFLMLFEKYFVKVNVNTKTQSIYRFDNMHINDFSFNENKEGEFLLCGD